MTTEAGCYEADDKEDEKRQQILPFAATRLSLALFSSLESPLDCKEIQPVHPKGDQSCIFIGRTNAEAEPQCFGHLMQRTDSFEETPMLGKIKDRRRSG